MKTMSFAVAFVATLGLTACQTTTQSGHGNISELEYKFQLTKIKACDYGDRDAYPYLKKRRPADKLSAFAQVYKANKLRCNEAEQAQSVGEKIAWLKKTDNFSRESLKVLVSYHRRGVEEDVTLWQYVACEHPPRGREVAALNFVIKHSPNFEERLKNQYQKIEREKPPLSCNCT